MRRCIIRKSIEAAVCYVYDTQYIVYARDVCAQGQSNVEAVYEHRDATES